MTTPRTLAVLGAGKLGTTIGRLAARAGWDVRITGSPTRPLQGLVVETLVPGARLLPEAEAIDGAAVVVLAVPFAKLATIGFEALSGKVVVDATNHWEAVDGDVPALAGFDGLTTSALVRALNPRVRLVKSLNHVGYDDLEALARPAGHATRRGIVVASDDAQAAELVARLVDDLGFDPVPAPCAAAPLLEPDGPVFGRRLTADELRELLGRAEESGAPVASGS